ncbi:site-specific integrase [Apibacter adventoris]|uniref:site-specific integrase n=1 Tax=Apibacter adventoris TaxID=1679466 RepID=UPI0015E37FB1|nr:site-specific integrase [Apibacter adventoris]
MNTKFIVRNYKNQKGLSLMYLSITQKGIRRRLSLDIRIEPNKFDPISQKVIIKDKVDKDIQLILDNIAAKITNIKTYYRLADQVLTVDKLVEELKNNVPRGEFISFFQYELNKDKILLKPGTFKRHQSILNNLKKYKNEIYFTDINVNFISDYKRYFIKTGRSLNTYYSNLKIIKKYLKRALKSGINLLIDLDDIKVKNIRSNRVALSTEELKLLYNYYFSEFINPGQKIPLGTFLFSCYTGLRISDIQKITREQVFSGLLEFIPVKTETNKPYIHRLKINEKAISIINHTPDLLVNRLSEQYINLSYDK